MDPKDEEEGLDQSYHGGSAYGGTEGEKHFECVHCLASYPYKRATPVSEGSAVRPSGVAQQRRRPIVWKHCFREGDKGSWLILCVTRVEVDLLCAFHPPWF